ncbi:NAD-dependent epimerase/dehydratase family protein [Algoriphagus antarcticus]|uniref:Nucleoside-diphosphate-sugar epimerase n=1 Tax=Algoriphagus antarcticus TaxID=238540 RepID=A0A3E0DKC0_9BACT|nr:NAD-dependent epimerase/dehydratase family protein [Algoriphagus antarcticus]REG82519.1 nucleoside-diphosphate-sugar epimerase [Algoriphagus antarcticus]
MSLHTVLGANGNIAKVVSTELHQKGITVRQFSRKPAKVNDTDELYPGDLLDSNAVSQAVKGAEVVYLLAGIQYKAAIWERDWPIIMRNTLDACIQHGAKLVFFDNMYAYDPEQVGKLTEETPLNPQSRKGKVRKQILDMLWKDVTTGKLKALVARAADFYGPDASNSVLNEIVINRMKAGKGAQCLYSSTKKHSWTYIPDAGKATAFLGLQEDSWNQSWHLPTDPAYSSVQEIHAILNKKLGTKLKLQVMPSWLVRVLGLFIPVMKEVVELRYQMDSDYRFDSSKIEKTYGLKPTSIEVGLQGCI